MNTKLSRHDCDHRCHSENGHHAWPSPATTDLDKPCSCATCRLFERKEQHA
jgi:hypothetical protein